MSTFSLVLKNTFAQAGGKVVTLGLSIVITALLARSLGVEGYGNYTFITAFVLLFGNIADWGTNIISVREASAQKALAPRIFGNVTIFRSLLALLALLLANFAIRINPAWSELVIPTTIASFVILALSLKTSFGVVFQTLLRFDLASLVEIVATSLFLVFVFLSPKNLQYILGSWFLSTLFASFFAWFLVRRITPIIWGLDTSVIKKIFKEALPAGALFLVFTIYNRIDTLILQNFLGSDAVGIYGLAYKMHDNFVMGAAFLLNSLFPLLSQSFRSQNREGLKNLYQKVFDLLIIFAIPLFILGFFTSPLLVDILGGRAFAPSVPVLRILLVATVFAYINHLTGYSLIAFGKQRLSLLIAIAALVFNVAANWILIPIYSYSASAWVTVATEGMVLVLSTIVIKNSIGIFPSLFSWVTTLKLLIKNRTINF